MIKVGLIGCGKISSGHLHAFEDIEDAKIVAACDISEPNLNSVCERTGAKGYTDYKKMVDEEELDLAIITLPHGLHGESTCYCAEKGVDVFLEKPMGVDSEDCKKMIETCKKNNVMLWVGHLQCYMPSNIEAKKLIDSGELGELVAYSETRNLNYFSADRPKWFLTKKMSGGGIMINLGAHALDKLKYYTNNATIEEITGRIHIRDGYDVEDSGQALVRMSNGVTATLNLIGHTAAGHYEASLYLTKGEIRVQGTGAIEYCKEDGKFIKVEIDQKPGMYYQIHDLIDRIRSGNRTPGVSGEYGLDIIHAVKRLYGDEE